MKLIITALQSLTSTVQIKGLPKLIYKFRKMVSNRRGIYEIYAPPLKLRIDNDACYQLWNVFNYGGFEIIKIMEQVLRPGDIYVDVGANIGYMSICAASIVGHTGCVMAIEPEPRCNEKLQYNLSLNDAIKNIVKVYSLAISDTGGVMEFCVATEEGLSRFDNGRVNPCMDLVETITVQAVTLDSLCADLKKYPRFIKIDVEGFEHRVLGGAKKLIEGQETIFSFEYNPGALDQNDVSLGDLLRFFDDRFYALAINGHSADWFRWGRTPTLEPIDDIVQFRHTRGAGTSDILVIPKSLIGLVDKLTFHIDKRRK